MVNERIPQQGPFYWSFTRQNQDIIKNQADAIQKFLTGEGVQLPRGKVLDMLARLTGDKEWNALSRRLKASAPGTEKPRYIEVLRSLSSTLSTAKSSLDDASSVVDPGEGEEYAYEAELELLESEIERVDRLIEGEKLVKTEGVTLLSVGQPDGLEDFTFLVPAHIDAGTLEQKLLDWLDKRESLRNKFFDMSMLDEAYDALDAELETKWGREGFVAEARRLGAIVPARHRMRRLLD